LTGGEQLEQLYHELSLLSPKPGSVFIYTRGVVDRLIVDLGFRRKSDDGSLALGFVDRTDCYYPFNTVLEYFLQGFFAEGKIRENGEGTALFRQDRRREESPATMIESIYEQIDLNLLSIKLAELLADRINPRLILSPRFDEPPCGKAYLQAAEVDLLLGALLANHGLENNLAMLALIQNENSIRALRSTGLWSIFIQKIKDHVTDSFFRPNGGFLRPTFLAWILENKPELIPEIILWLEDNLSQFLINNRSLQTLERLYKKFSREFNLPIAQYINSKERVYNIDPSRPFWFQ